VHANIWRKKKTKEILLTAMKGKNSMKAKGNCEKELTPAWIVLDKEFIQCHPAASYSHHHRASQDSN
jgi:hypothetical protein